MNDKYKNVVIRCFEKSGISPPAGLYTLQLNLEEVDMCIDCVSNNLCKDGFEENDEPNCYGIQLEEVIDFLLSIRYSLEDSDFTIK